MGRGQKKTLEQAEKEISEKYTHLKLLMFEGNDKDALFEDFEYGYFIGVYRRILQGNKNHEMRGVINRSVNREKTMLAKHGVRNVSGTKENIAKLILRCTKTFDRAEKEINNKQPHLTLLEFNGNEGIAKFNDNEFGDFSGNYRNILRGQKHHPDRRNKNLNKRTFDQAFKEIELKQPHLKLLDFTNSHSEAKFIDEKYGEFVGLFKLVLIGRKNHRQRARDNRRKTEKSAEEKLLKLKPYIKILKFNGLDKPSSFYDEQFGEFDGYFDRVARGTKNHSLRAQENRAATLKLSLKKSIKSDDWLNEVEKELEYSVEREYHILGTNFHADGYDPITNTIYEFHGDYWHGNPNIFDANKYNKNCKKTFGDLFKKTLEKEKVIKSLGYNIITMWENDYMKLKTNKEIYDKSRTA